MNEKIGDKDKFRIAQESFQAVSRAESMVRIVFDAVETSRLIYVLLVL